MRVIRWFFALAAAYGLVATLSLYRAPLSGETQWLYAFAGAAAATQLLYLLIAADPRRYRPAILVGIASKLSFAIPATILFAREVVPQSLFDAALADLALAALFLASFVALGRRPR